MTETKTIIENDVLEISTPRPDHVIQYTKEGLLAEKARIELLLAEFDK